MYQLSHLLTEQRSLIVSLLEHSLLGAKAPGLHGIEAKPESKNSNVVQVIAQLNGTNEEGRKRLTALLEKVEGCAVSFVCHLYNSLVMPSISIFRVWLRMSTGY